MRNLIKKAILLLLALSILVLPEINPSVLAASKTTFSDVKASSWYYSYVTRLAELKITGGYTDGTYRPNNSVTRAELVTFLCNVKGYKQMQGDPFADTQKSWASGYITAALANGFIVLSEDKKFRPNDAITRQEVAEIMCKALNIQADTTTKSPYADVTNDTGYSTAAYTNYLMRGSEKGGMIYFQPKDKLTRAEAAAVIVNAYDYNLDKMAYLNRKIAEENEKEAETEKHQNWLNSIDKGVSKELLSNIDGITGGKTVEECNQYATKELEEFEYWMKDCNITNVEDFKKEFVRVGKAYMLSYHNRSYLKLDELNQNMKKLWASIYVDNYLERNLNSIKDETVVKESEFFSGEGLIFINNGTPVLRGTLKYRYLSPTKSSMLKKDFCDETGKSCELNVWYTADYEISFIPENGLKVNGDKAISLTRLVR